MKIPEPKKMTSGNWYIRLRLGGKDTSVVAPTKKAAIAQAAAIKAGFIEAKNNPLSISLGDAYRRYIEAKEGVLSPSTVAGYQRLSRNTFQGIMSQKLQLLTNEQIQKEISAMAKAGKSPKYIRNAEGLLSSVLKMYHPDFRLNVFLPQKEKIEPRKIDAPELKAIMKASVGTPIELPVLMASWLGMRLSEIRGAKFSDIHDHRIHISRAIVDDVDGKAVTKLPKTFSGDRWIPIPDRIEQLIWAQPQDTEYIVNLSGQAIYKRFTRMLEDNGIEHCRFHDLRHANAAAMILLGIDSKYAQERNGWNSDWMYKQVYGYTMPSEMDAAADAMNKYFTALLSD